MSDRTEQPAAGYGTPALSWILGEGLVFPRPPESPA
ncbi:hypothetical protein SGPA1_11739 [Streptomyces misionensis JCM 4497]